mgnify:CR=1 FL=1
MITIDSPESLIIAPPYLLAVLVVIVSPLSDKIDSLESLIIAPPHLLAVLVVIVASLSDKDR